MIQPTLFGNTPPPSTANGTYLPQALRPYQAGAITAIDTAFSAGYSAPLYSMATGGGKTTIAAEYMRQVVDPAIHRALVVAHTEEIIFQLRDRIDNQFGGLLNGYYRGYPGLGIVMAGLDENSARIVVATRQSLHSRRISQVLEAGAFDYLIIDEAHHALMSNTYGNIVKALLAANPKLKIIGMTATPKRTDKAALGGIFDTIADEWTIQDGVDTGFLSPPVRIEVATGIDASEIKTSRGDYNNRRLLSLLDLSNWQELAMETYREHVQPLERPTLAFMPSVGMSQEFVTMLNAEGVPAAHIDGTTPKQERRKILRQYMNGKVKVVSNFGVLTEGFDAPHTGVIFLARPTRSSILFTQIVGRGLRRYPGKENCIIVDLTVRDTKALKRGTLLGKMFTCVCGAQFFESLGICPVCDLPIPEPEEKEETEPGERVRARLSYRGKGLHVTPSSIFEDAWSAWFKDATGVSTCALGDEGSLAVIPPHSDDYYRLYHVPKPSNGMVKLVSRNADFASILMEADKYSRKQAVEILADKNAPWRETPASGGQLRFLAKLGVKPDGSMTKGDAAQVITHVLATQRLVRVLPPEGN